MNSATSAVASAPLTRRVRQPIIREHPAVLSDIYEGETNIVVWQRQLDADLVEAASVLLQSHPKLQVSMVVTPDNVLNTLCSLHEMNHETNQVLINDIENLVGMFCCLFDLKQVGLRLSVLDRAMCPRFHVDRVPCRLVTTYLGIATDWLAHSDVDRTKLGIPNHGKTDLELGLYESEKSIRQLNAGDVALLKGELWEGNEGAGLVHRSPQVENGTHRLLLTLDFIDE